MRLIIDIDENVFTKLFDNGIEDYEIVNDDLFAIAKAIRKGTPLPKGHGSIYDENELRKWIIEGHEEGCGYIDERDIVDIPALIEADKEE